MVILCVHQKLCLGLHVVDAIEDVRGENCEEGQGMVRGREGGREGGRVTWWYAG
jgi:hypothetical protein